MFKYVCISLPSMSGVASGLTQEIQNVWWTNW
jgi:hypothetical protein